VARVRTETMAAIVVFIMSIFSSYGRGYVILVSERVFMMMNNRKKPLIDANED
jgi:hypothetical protein